jgi:hypothetical protein
VPTIQYAPRAVVHSLAFHVPPPFCAPHVSGCLVV